jgi:hypothetical protein
MSTSKLVKTQLEADEEFNKMLLERENKKWEHDQLHMEVGIG